MGEVAAARVRVSVKVEGPVGEVAPAGELTSLNFLTNIVTKCTMTADQNHKRLLQSFINSLDRDHLSQLNLFLHIIHMEGSIFSSTRHVSNNHLV